MLRDEQNPTFFPDALLYPLAISEWRDLSRFLYFAEKVAMREYVEFNAAPDAV